MGKEFVNEAVWDRILRIVLGGIMIYLGWFVLTGSLWGATLKIFAVIPIVTGIIGWDPFYTLLGLSTKTVNRNRTPDSG